MVQNELKHKILAAVQEFTHKENVKKISLFGSFLRNNASALDVDLLIELKEPVGYFELVRMERKLQEKIGLPVDLVEPDALSRLFREDVLKEAQPLYER